LALALPFFNYSTALLARRREEHAEKSLKKVIGKSFTGSAIVVFHWDLKECLALTVIVYFLFTVFTLIITHT